MDETKKAPTPIGAQDENYESDIYYRRRDRGAREYRRGMATRTGQKALRRMLGPKSEPGKASDYMQKVHEFIEQYPDIVVYIIVRESTRNQRRRRNHDNYRLMVEELKERGVPVHIFPVTCSGKIIELEWRDTLEWIVQKAQKQAAETGKTVAILAYSADRFLRNVHYKNTTPKLLPTRWEYRQLERLAHGVPLLTWVDPETPALVVRGKQTKLGQQTKGNKGGRPRKLTRAEHKDLLFPDVERLRIRTRRGYCWIAKQIKADWKLPLSSRTVMRWLKEVA